MRSRIALCIPAVAVMLCPLALAQENTQFPWQEDYAKVLPSGDLAWQPQPFVFQAGKTVRYIDYQGGDDADPGTRARPWKHHPWDPAAGGQAARHAGATTYVFKRGVTYRGVFRPDESGTAEAPIRLTSDPDWGSGEARIYASRQLTGKWTRGTDRDDIPQPDKVWTMKLDFLPRTLWLVAGENITRLPIARDPNWSETDPQDPMSQWYQWEQPRWWTGANKTRFEGKSYHLGVDTKHLTGPAGRYEGGTVWTEWGIVMGSPYPTRIRKYDAEKKALVFGGPWVVFGSEQVIKGNRYYLEDLPHWLDSAGEWWFQKQGSGGTLHLRLPGDADPNDAVLEAGRHVSILQSDKLEHVHITGLTFRFTNWHWDYNMPSWSHPDQKGAVIRLTGGGGDVVVANNTFEHVQIPVRVDVPTDGRLTSLAFNDNVVRYTDHGAIHVRNTEKKKGDGPLRGKIDRVEILRNNLYHIGWRVTPGAHGHAISVQQATLVHTAGNMLERIGGWGISISGGKRWGSPAVPLNRLITHQNRVKDCLLKSCDWGAFYMTQGGPHYIYNNVAINPVGQMHWTGRRLGYAYYMDGGYKGYLFNNIAAGLDNEGDLANAAAFQSMISFENNYFNNTVYRWKTGSRRQAPQGSREKYLGNIFADIREWTFRHAKPAESPAAANEAHLPEEDAEYLYETIAIGHNVLYDVGGPLGVFESNGMPYANLAAFSRGLAEKKAMVSDVGVMASSMPLRDPAEGDYRPVADSAAAGRGVRMFVPWGIYAPVGEWNFTVNRRDPGIILDEHWFMQAYFVDRAMYRQTPRYHLHAEGVGADDYGPGRLEDWIDGALKLDGEETFARVAHAELVKDFTYVQPGRRGAKGQAVTVPGREKKTLDMDTNNFLIEVYLRTADGDGGGIAGKSDGRNGYELVLRPDGVVAMEIISQGRRHTLPGGKIADGQWHHVIAQVDRKAGTWTLFVDGKRAAKANLPLMPAASLANGADFLVARSAGGSFLSGWIDFLRVGRGTLGDARTTIEELYAWQFDGPHMRDFTGRTRKPGQTAAGAIEMED